MLNKLQQTEGIIQKNNTCLVGKSKPKGLILAYTRVSSRNQIDDLTSQTEFLKQFVNVKGEILDDVISDMLRS